MQIVRRAGARREMSAGIVLVAVLTLFVAVHLGTRASI
ncbi:hypothetical protein ABIB80_007469 [Bradyrhizobium sp. i1.15.2]